MDLHWHTAPYSHATCMLRIHISKCFQKVSIKCPLPFTLFRESCQLTLLYTAGVVALVIEEAAATAAGGCGSSTRIACRESTRIQSLLPVSPSPYIINHLAAEDSTLLYVSCCLCWFFVLTHSMSPDRLTKTKEIVQYKTLTQNHFKAQPTYKGVEASAATFGSLPCLTEEGFAAGWGDERVFYARQTSTTHNNNGRGRTAAAPTPTECATTAGAAQALRPPSILVIVSNDPNDVETRHERTSSRAEHRVISQLLFFLLLICSLKYL